MENATVRAEENVKSIDRMLFAQLGRFTLGLSPAARSKSWQATAPKHEGSWWPAWQAWIAARSSSRFWLRAGAPEPGYPPLSNAPGTYVLEP